jgi:CheY-like chemotaxis protein
MEACTMANKTVLLVDDDVDFLEVNKMALEAAGYRVLLAHDGAEALKIAADTPVDAAVLDVIMNTADEGFHLARSLRKDVRTKAIPLLMLTSVNAVNEAKGFLFRLSDRDHDEMWLPIDRFVDKPIKPERLIETVRELTGG